MLRPPYVSITSISRSSVTANWVNIEGAKYYYVSIVNSNNKIVDNSTMRTASTSVNIRDISLSPTEWYYVLVEAFSWDEKFSDPNPFETVNISFGSSAGFYPN